MALGRFVHRSQRADPLRNPLPCRSQAKASILANPSGIDQLSEMLPASKAEQVLVQKAGSKMSHLPARNCLCVLHHRPLSAQGTMYT